MKHYVQSVFGCVEPELHGPFETPEIRLAEAKKIHEKQDMEDAIFWLDVDENGVPTVGAFISGDLDDDEDGDEELAGK